MGIVRKGPQVPLSPEAEPNREVVTAVAGRVSETLTIYAQTGGAVLATEAEPLEATSDSDATVES